MGMYEKGKGNNYTATKKEGVSVGGNSIAQ